MLTARQECLKRCFDIAIAIPVVLLLWPLCLLLIGIATVDTGSFGLFVQIRIGRFGRPFKLYKIRTMRANCDDNTVTVAGDTRITRLGRTLRRLKLDEIPQFWHVLTGSLSLVGPRPDVAGFADTLTGDARIILTLRPGITGASSIRWRDEEAVLSSVERPIEFNCTTVWPDKVRCNMEYIERWSLRLDIQLLAATVLPGHVQTAWPSVQNAGDLANRE
ncbi:MAG: sugar transferase [Phycisphaerae bacterium]|nr:sugar transferase [Phycisphaerae bacterium]